MNEKIKKTLSSISYNTKDIADIIRAKTIIENPKLFTEKEYPMYLQWAENVIKDGINI